MTRAEFCAFLREHDNFVILTHRRPDGDTIGCASALCLGLRQLGKSAAVLRNEQFTPRFAALLEGLACEDAPADACVISTDIASEGLLSFDAVRLGLTPVCAVDHHGSNSLACPKLVEADKAACGEIVHALLTELGVTVTKRIAECLYTAISTDTGCFCYANTNSATFRAAARLCDAGADLPLLNKIFFRTKSPARLALEGMVCSSLRSYRDHAINIAVITLDMLRRAGVTEDDCSDLASLAGQVRGNRVAITVRELSVDPPRSKVSLRTDGGVDASQVCARFGGGGHKMASGCELDLPPDETADAVRRAVEEVWA